MVTRGQRPVPKRPRGLRPPDPHRTRRTGAGSADGGHRRWWWAIVVPVILALVTWAISYFGPGISHTIGTAVRGSPSATAAPPTSAASPTTAAPLTTTAPPTSTAPSTSAAPSISGAFGSCAALAPFASCSVSAQGSGYFVTRQPMDVGQIPVCGGDNPAWSAWQEQNAVDGKAYHVIVNLLVQQDVIVNVRDLTVIRDAAQPAPGGDVLACAGGLEATYFADVDLSTNPPSVRYRCPTGPCDGLSINATQGDRITIEVSVFPGPAMLDTWHGSMDMLLGTRKVTLPFGRHQISDYPDTQPIYEPNGETPPGWERIQ